MSETSKYFKKAGGKKLLAQYFKAGVLHTALLEYATLGKSKTALEILRLSVQLKTQQKLAKKYKKFLKAYSLPQGELQRLKSNKVWVLWWQGIENAPNEVKACWESIHKYLSAQWEIILLTKDNYKDYVQFPESVEKRIESGAITLTHLSDLIRLELLIKYGGLWIDSTVLCTSSFVPKSILDADLFVFQPLKPGANGKAILLSSWLMYSSTNHPILLLTRDMLYDYWKRNNSMIDYFLLHHFFSIACRHFPEEYEKIPPFCNSVPHILQLHIFQPFNQDLYDDWRHLTSFHKLTYKFEEEDKKKTGTFYDEIIRHKNF